MLKPKPLWLQQVTPSNTWVTIAPDIYYPTYIKDPSLYPDVIAHEEVHIRQQESMGLSIWMARYFGDRLFRMDQECQAAAAQINEDPSTKEWVIQSFERTLNTATYLYCDVTPEMVRTTIEGYLSLYHTCAENPVIRWERYLASLPPLDYSKYSGTWIYPDTPSTKIQLDYTPWPFEDTYEGYVYNSPVQSNNKGRRSNEDGQDFSSDAGVNSWYKDPILMDKYLDRY